MAIRKIAAVSIAAALMLGTSGCNFMSPVASRLEYAPSDGTQIDLQNVKARNFIYVAGEEFGGLFGTLVNPSMETQTVRIQYTDATLNEKKSVSVNLLPGSSLDIGYNGTAPLLMDLGSAPGKIVSIYLNEGAESGRALNVPVLDGTLAEYKVLEEALQSAVPASVN